MTLPGNSEPEPIALAVLISGSGSNLQALIDASIKGEINARICAVFSNRPNCYGITRAEQADIPVAVIDHKLFASREAFDLELARQIEAFNPDLIVLAGFMRILSAQFVSKFAGKLLNIHPSLLPKYPGLDTHQRAIDANDSEAGATVHFVTAELDGGPPVVQAKVPIKQSDTAESLAERILLKEHKIYPLAVKWFAEQRLQLVNNQAMLDNKPLPEHGYQFIDNE